MLSLLIFVKFTVCDGRNILLPMCAELIRATGERRGNAMSNKIAVAIGVQVTGRVLSSSSAINATPDHGKKLNVWKHIIFVRSYMMYKRTKINVQK